ncbi:MAG: DUF433 domain-containing protein [Verrucomicrobia bacterium]|nr:DUF433 domain-containing protein [Verrucomicrobiota bacterium]
MVTLEHSPVSSSRKVLGGTFVLRVTRVPTQTLLDYFDDGRSLYEVLEPFPSVRLENARDFLTLNRSTKSQMSTASGMTNQPG